MKVSIVIES